MHSTASRPAAGQSHPAVGFFRFPAMGTDFEVLTCPDDGGRAGSRVQRQVGRWEARFSRFRGESELSALNRSAGTGWLPASPEMIEVLELSTAAREQTGGIFEPGILGSLEGAGYDRSFEPGLPAVSPPPAGPAPHAEIELDRVGGLVRLSSPIDLGGIVKGWAVDRLIQEVGANGVVNAGGDLRAVGPGDEGDGWPIGIEDPRARGEDAFVVVLQDESLATSGINRRRWGPLGEQHHLIDPRIGRPAETDVLAATALAPTCLEAEIATKTALILGRKAGLDFLVRRGRAGLLALTDGTWQATVRMQERLR